MKKTSKISTRIALAMFLLSVAFTWGAAQNNALHFDGVNDHVGINAPKNIPAGSYSYNFERPNPFSIEMWIKPETGGTLFGRIPNIHQSGFRGYELSLGSDGKLLMQMVSNYQAGNAIAVRSNAAVPMDGKWHHVAMSYDGSSKAAGIALYLDGAAMAATTENDKLTESMAQNVGIIMGCRVDGLSKPGLVYKGAMDEVRLWKVAISAADVSSRLNSELAGNEANLVLYNNFNQGTAGGNNAGVTVSSLPNSAYAVLLMNFALNGNTSNFIGVKTVCTRQ